MSIQVIITEPFSDRPCDFCLTLQDHRVYADFVIDPNEQVKLVGISFDGYGYNGGLERIERMNPADSSKLAEAVRRNDVNTPDIHRILLHYFSDNRSLIWRDALEKHSLLP